MPLTDFLAYQLHEGRSLPARAAASTVFSEAALAGYLVNLRRRAKAKEITAGTVRTWGSAVFALARTLQVHNPELDSTGHTHRTPPLPPMSSVTFARWLETAEAQVGSTRVQLLLLLLVVRGAGLASEDLRELRGRDVVRRRDGCVVVHVRGANPRTALVLERFADGLLQVAGMVGDRLAVGQWPGRKNVVSSLLDDLVAGTDLDRAWLVDRVRWAYIAEVASTNASPLQLMRQLGAQSLAPIESALPHVVDLALSDMALRLGTGGVGPLAGLDAVSDADLRELLDAARRQPQPTRGQLQALLLGGRGGGLVNADFGVARGRDVVRRPDGALVVQVRRREAVILDRFAESLECAARHLGDDLLVPGASNAALAALLDQLPDVRHLPRPIPRRLRRSYLVEIGSTNLSPRQLLRQLGTTSLAPIEAVLPWLTADGLDDAGLRKGLDSASSR